VLEEGFPQRVLGERAAGQAGEEQRDAGEISVFQSHFPGSAAVGITKTTEWGTAKLWNVSLSGQKTSIPAAGGGRRRRGFVPWLTDTVRGEDVSSGHVRQVLHPVPPDRRDLARRQRVRG